MRLTLCIVISGSNLDAAACPFWVGECLTGRYRLASLRKSPIRSRVFESYNPSWIWLVGVVSRDWRGIPMFDEEDEELWRHLEEHQRKQNWVRVGNAELGVCVIGGRMANGNKFVFEYEDGNCPVFDEDPIFFVERTFRHLGHIYNLDLDLRCCRLAWFSRKALQRGIRAPKIIEIPEEKGKRWESGIREELQLRFQTHTELDE